MAYNEQTMTDECMPCIDNCDICYDAYSCELCITDFNIVTDQTAAGELVYTCEPATEPPTCDYGLYFDVYTNDCEFCSEGCADCSEHYYCHQCHDGFALEYTSDQTEAWCYSTVTCTEGNFLNEFNECLPCSDNCAHCNYGD